jgi:hypothetical protein
MSDNAKEFLFQIGPIPAILLVFIPWAVGVGTILAWIVEGAFS